MCSPPCLQPSCSTGSASTMESDRWVGVLVSGWFEWVVWWMGGLVSEFGLVGGLVSGWFTWLVGDGRFRKGWL